MSRRRSSKYQHPADERFEREFANPALGVPDDIADQFIMMSSSETSAAAQKSNVTKRKTPSPTELAASSSKQCRANSAKSTVDAKASKRKTPSPTEQSTLSRNRDSAAKNNATTTATTTTLSTSSNADEAGTSTSATTAPKPRGRVGTKRTMKISTKLEKPDKETKRKKYKQRKSSDGRPLKRKLRAKDFGEKDLTDDVVAAQKLEQERLERVAKQREIELVELSSDSSDTDEVHETSAQSSAAATLRLAALKSLHNAREADKKQQHPQRSTTAGGVKTARKAKDYTDDWTNYPTRDGCVLLNAGHPDTELDVLVQKSLTDVLKPHQISGVRFLYDNIIESPTDYDTSTGFGCILAHSMGLGKTLQVITFIDLLFRYTNGRRVLCVLPKNVLQNWLHEFDRWLPLRTGLQAWLDKSKTTTPLDESIGSSTTDTESTKDAPSSSSKPPTVAADGYRDFDVYQLNEHFKSWQQRAQLISQWHKGGGVMLIGYEMYRHLVMADVERMMRTVNKDKTRTVKKRPPVPVADKDQEKQCKSETSPDCVDIEREDEMRDIKRELCKALVNPGPDVIVCDEGHRIKEDKTNITHSLKSIKTRRRIVLTGYPLQNNLNEYYCMVDFVRPGYLGNRKQFRNMFEDPIKNGLCADSTPEDLRIARLRTHVLIDKLKGFVMRRSANLLRAILPLNREYVLLLRKSNTQRLLYKEFINNARQLLEENEANEDIRGIGGNLLSSFAVSIRICNHPDILWRMLRDQRNKKIETELLLTDLDLDVDTTTSKHSVKDKKIEAVSVSHPLAATSNSTPSSPGRSTMASTSKSIENFSFDWAEQVFNDHQYKTELEENGTKILVAMTLLRSAVAEGNKVLIYSQSLATLDTIETFLTSRPVKVHGQPMVWKKNRNYLRMQGSTSLKERDRLISRFNHETAVYLFLISTRAGSLGINLTAATRVIIFDASWNPCHDAQAVCRIYRYGQTQRTFIYRLIMDNSMERAVFNRQVAKHGMFRRVIDDRHTTTSVSSQELANLMAYDEQLDLCTDVPECETPINEDQILSDTFHKLGQSFAQAPFLHESLMTDSDQELSETEKREAKMMFDRELRGYVFGPTLAPPTASGGAAGTHRYTYPSTYPDWRAYPMGYARMHASAHRLRPIAAVGPTMRADPTPRPMELSVASSSAIDSIGGGAQTSGLIVNDRRYAHATSDVLQPVLVRTRYDCVLPSVTYPGMQHRVPLDVDAHLVRSPKGQLFLRLPDKHILLADGSPYDDMRSAPPLQRAALLGAAPLTPMAPQSHPISAASGILQASVPLPVPSSIRVPNPTQQRQHNRKKKHIECVDLGDTDSDE